MDALGLRVIFGCVFFLSVRGCLWVVMGVLLSGLQSCGPEFVRSMPLGFAVELVQLMLNQEILVFQRGRVLYVPTPGNQVFTSGHIIPKWMLRAYGRLLKSCPIIEAKSSKDPAAMLLALCTLQDPASVIPMYYYYKSGMLHSPSWYLRYYELIMH